MATGKRVVAEILEDGSVRGVGPLDGEGPDEPDWSTGRVFGDSWTIWWERRGGLTGSSEGR